MRLTTIKSYLYVQYADDDNLQAYVAAYNGCTQAYVDWFNTVCLPYYPGLTGDLLDWVAEGLYGEVRVPLASPVTPAEGMLNTEVLNSLTPLGMLNSYVPPSQTVFNLSDDLFQRVITWNFFKGDGKRFTQSWLKRRIMRFIMGANGIPPTPDLPGFTIGAETTSPVSVVISGGLLTVAIDQSLLSLLADVDPTVLQLFRLAFLGGVLDLPVQFTYACNIVTGFDALAVPSSLLSVSSEFSQTTDPTTVMVLGGSTSYTYAWTWLSGGSGISIDTPSSATTTFTASGLSWGQTVSGVAKCTVTDTVSAATTVATCSVTIECLMPSSILTQGRLALFVEGTTTALVVEP